MKPTPALIHSSFQLIHSCAGHISKYSAAPAATPEAAAALTPARIAALAKEYAELIAMMQNAINTLRDA